MRFMTYNIRLGRQRGVDAIADVIHAQRPDVVALQEVGRGWREGPAGDTTRTLAGRLALPHHLHVPAIDEAGALYGHALLSRWPIASSEVEPLPRGVDEPRVLLRAVIDTPRGPLTLLTTHLSWIEDRPAQGEVLRQRALALAEQGARVVVMGDLNEHEPTPWLEALREHLHDADAALARPTYPADAPRIRIDYLLSSHGEWREVAVPRELDASDHRPVCATLAW